MSLYYTEFTKRQLSEELSVCSFACRWHRLSHSCYKLTATWKKHALFKRGTSLFFLPLPCPPFSNQNIPRVLLIHTAVKSADVSGGRPEVILPQDPAPVPGLWMPGFPLWAPPRFSALESGWGAVWEALRTEPQTDRLVKVIFKVIPPCPRSAVPLLLPAVLEKGELKGYCVTVELCRSWP